MLQVYQEDADGCWIACVSMISGRSYSDIAARHKFRKAVTGRSAGPVVRLLDELGYHCDERSTKLGKVGALQFLKDDALVYAKNLNKHGRELGGHWMVWDAEASTLRDPEGWSADRRRLIKSFRVVKQKKPAGL